jgi:hypothetical protein
LGADVSSSRLADADADADAVTAEREIGERTWAAAGCAEAPRENAAEGETEAPEDAGRAPAVIAAPVIGCAETLAARPSDSAPKQAPA